ncbi:MarR family winged helix-turn-helix transcriptional regulator [uncultured Deinococcus sp.]|uniref:MarR family winged helix-turn-helix transcriptional regulator n=1 Tax=uncultured Deinococcus sp. TaxID=158789 RepID=UPI00258D669C|nr:MarR family winged helix-turn-helix transcriptional regulator [uncultured Deinococcus sp.]
MAISPPTPHETEETSRFLQAMWQFNRALGQELQPLLQDAHDTDPRSFMLLKTIESGLTYPKVIAQELKLPPTLLSRYLDDLSKRGLLERHIDEQDSRRTRLSLTQAGEALLQATQCTVHTHVARRLARLRPEQLRALNDALHALNSGEEQA